MEFLSPKNDCGQSILSLVSRGNAIIAELLRLSGNVPEPFTDYLNPTAGSVAAYEIGKFSALLFDFSYLSHQEYYDELIEKRNLFELDMELKDKYFPLLERFYLLFGSIWKYYVDYEKFMDDLLEGVFTQYTLEDVLKDFDGKQLLAEAVYLLGVMLFLMDMKIPGELREKLLVTYIRFKGYSEVDDVDEICSLCKRTGLLYQPMGKLAKTPKNYPLDLFSRCKLKEDPLEMIIGRLRSDDLYNQLATYPNPRHRSVALANQSAMLFVALFFMPRIIVSEDATMREIVDKYFADNWVISFYLGYTADLNVWWDSFSAARAALQNTVDMKNVRLVQQYHIGKLPELREKLNHYLMEGILNRSYVLDNINRLVNSARECNVTLRWLLMHAITAAKKTREAVLLGTNPDEILQLILDVAQYEYLLKKYLNELLDTKEESWEKHVKECCERMHELGEYFSGEKALTRVEKHVQLSDWFFEIETQIDSLDFEDAVFAGRKIKQLSRSLEEISDYHMIMDNFHIKHFLSDTVDYLMILMKTANIRESMMVSLSIISDFSYATQCITGYVDLMQNRIKQDPSNVIKLRSTFLKQASMMDIPLVRINQANSPDLISVSKYYSGTLVSYVRLVLEIVPRSMFHLLNRIMKVNIKELPTRVEYSKLKEFAQLDERSELSDLTHKVSLFTKGILAMETTLVGVVKVEPKQLLDDGIRKELVAMIASTLNSLIQFDGDRGFLGKMATLAETLEGFRLSFEYISDYVNIYGMKMWQEEFTRIIGFNVDMECNEFLKKKIKTSKWQSDTVPIPRYPPTDSASLNFIGRLVRVLLEKTSFRSTVYVDQLSSWIDRRTGDEIVGLRTFSVLHKAIGTPGLYGVDRLLSFMIAHDLQNYIQKYRKIIADESENAKYLDALLSKLEPRQHGSKLHNKKLYSDANAKFAKNWNDFLVTTLILGHKQLLKKQISTELNFSCKLDANILFSSLGTLNEAILKDVKNHYRNPEANVYPGAAIAAESDEGVPGETDSPLLSKLSEYLDNCGMQFPLHKIYVTTEPLSGLSTLLFLFVVATVPKFSWDFELGTFIGPKPKSAKKESLDGAPYIMGMTTILKQFHSRYTEEFVALLGQYVRSSINFETAAYESATAKVRASQMPGIFPQEVKSVLWFLEEFCRVSRVPRETIEQHVPAFVFDVKSSFIS